MADKEFPLTLVIRTVDKATAGLQKFNSNIEAAFKPYRAFGKQLGELSENLGLPKVKESLSKVGGEIKGLVKEFALLSLEVGVVGEEIIRRTIDFGDNLAKTADRIGLSVDALAQLRFAAKLSGVSVEEMDGALEKFSKNLGLAKANSGPLKDFLEKVSPALLKQLKAAKGNAEAFDLMADAMVKVKDPAKQAALVTEIFGRGGAPMINLLTKGSRGINELRERYKELAGSQEGFARNSEKVHEAFDEVEASMGGVVATIVTALSPVILDLAQKFTKFITDHREQIAAWAKDFSEKLPGIIDYIGQLFDKFKTVWDAIGGAKGALLLFVGVKLAPLALSVGELLVSLGKMVLAIRAANVAAAEGGGGGAAGVGGTVGKKIAGATAAGAAGFALGSYADEKLGLSNQIAGVSGRGVGEHRSTLRQVLSLGKNIKEENDYADEDANRALADKVAAIRAANANQWYRQPGAPGSTQAGAVDVNVNIAGLPPGSRADVKSTGPVQSDLTTGYMMLAQ